MSYKILERQKENCGRYVLFFPDMRFQFCFNTDCWLHLLVYLLMEKLRI